MHAKSEGESSTSSGSFQQKLRLTTASLSAGDYRIGYSVEVTNSDKAKRAEVQVQVDDSTTIAEAGSPGLVDNNQYVTLSGFVVVTLSSGTHDIDIDYRALDETARVRRARLEIFAVP